MTAKEFYLQWGNTPMKDKHDKRMQLFSYDDMTDFAEQYANEKVKEKELKEAWIAMDKEDSAVYGVYTSKENAEKDWKDSEHIGISLIPLN